MGGLIIYQSLSVWHSILTCFILVDIQSIYQNKNCTHLNSPGFLFHTHFIQLSLRGLGTYSQWTNWRGSTTSQPHHSRQEYYVIQTANGEVGSVVPQGWEQRSAIHWLKESAEDTAALLVQSGTEEAANMFIQMVWQNYEDYTKRGPWSQGSKMCKGHD